MGAGLTAIVLFMAGAFLCRAKAKKEQLSKTAKEEVLFKYDRL
jgi:hypothetical protein